MVSIVCNCGFKVEDKDHHKAEAKAWHHAINEHLDMLKGMSVEQLEGVVKNSDKQMGI